MAAYEVLLKASRDLETEHALKNPMGQTATLLLKRMEKQFTQDQLGDKAI